MLYNQVNWRITFTTNYYYYTQNVAITVIHQALWRITFTTNYYYYKQDVAITVIHQALWRITFTTNYYYYYYKQNVAIIVIHQALWLHHSIPSKRTYRASALQCFFGMIRITRIMVHQWNPLAQNEFISFFEAPSSE